jgi:hypothetical protein
VLELLDDYYEANRTYRPASFSKADDARIKTLAYGVHMILNYGHEKPASQKDTLEPFYFASSVATIVNSLVTVPDLSDTSETEPLDPNELKEIIISTVDEYLTYSKALDNLIRTRINEFGIDPLLSEEEIRHSQPRILAGVAFFYLEVANETRFRQAQIDTLEKLFLE